MSLWKWKEVQEMLRYELIITVMNNPYIESFKNNIKDLKIVEIFPSALLYYSVFFLLIFQKRIL